MHIPAKKQKNLYHPVWNYEKPFCPSCVAGLSFCDVSPAAWPLTIVYKDMLIGINLVLVVSVACVKSYPP